MPSPSFFFQFSGTHPDLHSFPTRRSSDLAEVGLLRQYSPLVETYIQYLRPDNQTGAAPRGDKYFLGRAALSRGDRKSTRLNSSHMSISYAVFCLKKKKNKE